MKEKNCVFVSHVRNLRVAFPPETFGYKTDSRGKQQLFPCVKFVDRKCLLSDLDTVERMRKHRGNQVNGGNSFSEVAPQTMKALKGFKDQKIFPGEMAGEVIPAEAS